MRSGLSRSAWTTFYRFNHRFFTIAETPRENIA
jgi:hypothetical protein